MIIVDRALAERAAARDPVRVGMVGVGYMGRAIARQIVQHVPGMDLVSISNRTVDRAEEAYRHAGLDGVVKVRTVGELDDAIASGKPAVTDDPGLLSGAAGIHVILEVTGEVEFGAQVALEALGAGKHLVAMNAELDATLGPILKVYADRAGVVFTNVDGDEPGVTMGLFRFVESIGCRPVLTGNLKGILDHYRTPETQEGFAKATGQGARMVTSFADGTKLSMELTIVANATGFRVGKRGMFGHRTDDVWDVLKMFSEEQLLSGGLVDFLLGSEPKTGGAFVVAYDDDPERRRYMDYFKMGEGPFYVFYRPWHLPHLEAPHTIARAALFSDPAVTPRGAPSCDVLAVAKRDLKAGETLDGIGGFTCYGTIENAEVSRRERLLPMGLSEGCTLTADVAKDQAIAYGDVEVPEGRLADKLRAEQEAHFPA
jgi:predicted homoserine dehydrogenase-like protein